MGSYARTPAPVGEKQSEGDFKNCPLKVGWSDCYPGVDPGKASNKVVKCIYFFLTAVW